MHGWKWEVEEAAEKDLAKLDVETRRRIIERLDWFAENFEDATLLPLGGQYKGFYKFRVGDWRVVYRVDWSNESIAVVYIDIEVKSTRENDNRGNASKSGVFILEVIMVK